MEIVFKDITMNIDGWDFRSIYPDSFNGETLDQIDNSVKEVWYETLNGFKKTHKEAYFAVYYDYFLSLTDDLGFYDWYDDTDLSLEYVKQRVESRGVGLEFIKG